MVWIILGLVLGFGLGLIEDFSLALFMAALGAAIGFLVAILVGVVILSGHKDLERPPVALKTLVDNTYSEGQFFLGSGSVDGVPHYSWYEEVSDNNFVRRDAEADLAVVHYVKPGEKPYYVRTVQVPKNPGFMHTWGINVATEEYDKSYDFYIPEGSITSEYELDAK